MGLRCSKLDECVSKGQIYLNKKGKICLKRYSPDIQLIFFRKEESQYKQVLAVQALRNKSPDLKRGKIAGVKIIGKDMGEDIDLSDLKCEMDI
jgi:hypothetical protein